MLCHLVIRQNFYTAQEKWFLGFIDTLIEFTSTIDYIYSQWSNFL